MDPLPNFIPIGTLGDIIQKGPFQMRAFVDDSKLIEILDQCEKGNAVRTELVFAKIRQDNPFVDVLMIDDTGNPVHGWSTIPGYTMSGLPPTLKELGNLIIEQERMFYLVTSAESTFVFYSREHNKLLRDIHLVDSSPYEVPGLPGLINHATLKTVRPGEKNPFGIATLKTKGFVLGRLGYWKNLERNPEYSIGFGSARNEKFGAIASYIPRAIIDAHPFGKIHFTPLTPYDEMKGLGRKMKLVEDMHRIVTKGPTDDFIANVFINYTANPEVGAYPLILRHNTIRPWKS